MLLTKKRGKKKKARSQERGERKIARIIIFVCERAQQIVTT
jgi:hypothetical protein